MKQTKRQSLIEAASSTVVGFALSWALTPSILLAFGYNRPSVQTSFGIVSVYTALSMARGYVVRRFFNGAAH